VGVSVTKPTIGVFGACFLLRAAFLRRRWLIQPGIDERCFEEAVVSIGRWAGWDRWSRIVNGGFCALFSVRIFIHIP
jgi:hypothetical protein